MIITLLLSVVISIVSFLLVLLPSVTSLPVILGVDTQTVMNTAAGYINGLTQYIWPLQIVWACALWYFGLSIVLSLFRFFFGSRIPHI